jgi:hypothetical protein
MAETKYPADGFTYIGFLEDVEGDAFVDFHAPELAELTGHEDMSCWVTSGGLDLGVSTGTIDAASICSSVVAQSHGRTTVTPALTMWHYKQPEDTAYEFVEKGKVGWLFIRTGVEYDEALAEGDRIWIAYVELGEPATEFGGGDTNNTFTVNMLLTAGDKYDPKAVIGGGS